MKMRTLILVSLLVPGIGMASLAGCGQKGPLVLPRTPASSQAPTPAGAPATSPAPAASKAP
ncbi:MAG: lipoprotein [Comamonadaceae bacterium]|nr:lipoprotein [Comamonadaceae bacterium]